LVAAVAATRRTAMKIRSNVKAGGRGKNG